MRRTKKEIMQNVESEKSRVIDNNTVEYWKDGKKIIRLHLTDIITYNVDGSVTFNTDGWKTVTTKSRMNKYAPSSIYIYQEKSIWYLQSGIYDDPSKQTSVFYDGITVTVDGKILNPKQTDKQTNKTIKLIKEYCDKLNNLKKLPEPNGGDCWYCLFFDKDNKTNEKSTSTDHLIDHLKDRYIHGSIILNALKWAGYTNPGIIFQMDIRSSIVNVVRRYLKSNLGIAA